MYIFLIQYVTNYIIRWYISLSPDLIKKFLNSSVYNVDMTKFEKSKFYITTNKISH